MKKIVTTIILCILLKAQLIGQCSINTVITNDGNGHITATAHSTYPEGWIPYVVIDYPSINDNTTIGADSVVTGIHQYYFNYTFIIFSSISAYDPANPDSSIIAYDSDTITIDDIACHLDLEGIFESHTDSTYNFSCYPSGICPAAGLGTLMKNWTISDTLGNILYSYSGTDESITYSFSQNGLYSVKCFATFYDSITSQSCSDSAFYYLSYFPISCGQTINFNYQVLSGNTVKLTVMHPNPYNLSYFYIDGNYFWNTDSVTYTFQSSGTNWLNFYGLTTSNGSTCKDSLFHTFPVGNVNNTANASFTITQDQQDSSVWHATNNSTGNGGLLYLWDFGDGTSSTEIYPTHHYQTPGHYTICLTVSDINGQSTYCDSSVAFKLSQQQATSSTIGTLIVGAPSVGINEQKANTNEAKIYPNPLADRSTLQFNSAKDANGKIEVINLLGSTLAQQEISIHKGSNEQILSTADYPEGMYFVRVSSNGQILVTLKATK